MKQFLLATTLLVALTTGAFADGKKSNAKLLSDLTTSLKSVNEAAWKTTESYRKTTFTLNGKNVSAFLNAETNALIGFSIEINEASLPEGATQNIAKKFPGWQAINSIMFIDATGNIAYYVQVNKGKNSLALRISSKGQASIYDRIPH
jgi:hypothetical protein